MKLIWNKLLKLFILGLFLNLNYVYAEEYSLTKKRIPDAFAVYDAPDRLHLYYGETYIINNEEAYCIEPGIKIQTDYYKASSDLNISGLSNEVLKKVRLIAYYGYNYTGHKNNRYYMAAQELIWRTINGREVYWVNEEDIYGQRINIDNEKNNIKNLVNKHYTLPSFDNQEIVLEVGQSYALDDKNNVLSHFEIYDSPLDNLKIEGNKITMLASDSKESGEVKLTSKQYTDKVTLIYYQGNNQKMISSTGLLEPVTASFKIKVINKPYIKVVKIDKNTQKPVYLSGIKFKIKNLDLDEYVCENDECIYETDEYGTFITSNKLDYGNYELTEVDELIEGYLWNSEKLTFTIDETSEYQVDNGNLYYAISFANEPVTGSFELTKVGEEASFIDNRIIYNPVNLDNVVFNLYASNDIYDSQKTIIYQQDEFIGTYITIDGKIIIDNLPLGNYYIKEVVASHNHILDREKYYFSLMYQDEYTSHIKAVLTLNNYQAKGTLEFVKVDSVTGELLPNTEVALYSDDNQLIYTDITNDEGKIIIENLPLGKYYLKELIAPEGYSLSKDNIYFEIKNNNDYILTTMENNTIDVPNTNQNNNYHTYIISLIILILGVCIYRYEKK